MPRNLCSNLNLLKNIASTSKCFFPIMKRTMSHYPIDDQMFGLNVEQRQVKLIIIFAIILNFFSFVKQYFDSPKKNWLHLRKILTIKMAGTNFAIFGKFWDKMAFLELRRLLNMVGPDLAILSMSSSWRLIYHKSTI